MKCNRIICAVMLLIFVLSLYLPSYGIFAQDGEPSSVTIYEENFETGAFSTVDGMQGNNHTRTVTKSGVPEWTFEQYNGADISSWTGDIIYDNSATGDSSGIVNKSVILKSQAALSSTFLYHNLPQAYDTGIITVDISIRRPSNSTGVTMYFYEEPITSYAERTNPISQIWYESNSSGGSRAGYVNSYINSDSRSGTMWFDGSTWQTKKTWWQIRAIVNLDTKKTTVLYNNTNGGTLKTAVEGVNFMGIGAAGSYDMASSFGAIGFVAGSSSYTAGGSVLIDDIKITYEAPEQSSIISNLALTDQDGSPMSDQNLISLSGVTALGATASLNYPSGHSDSSITARLIIAAFDANGNLVAVRSGEDTTVTAANPSANMTIETLMDLSEIAPNINKVKLFAWNFNGIKPYGNLELTVTPN